MEIKLTEKQISLIEELKSFTATNDSESIKRIIVQAITTSLLEKILPIRRERAIARQQKLNASQLLNPQKGDLWEGQPAWLYKSRMFLVLRRVSENKVMVLRLPSNKDGTRVVETITREEMATRVHMDCGQEGRIIDLDPAHWLLDCNQLQEESSESQIINELNLYIDEIGFSDGRVTIPITII